MPTLDHVYFIGGSPCAGKTTIAHRLAERHGCTSYSCDDAWERHAALADPVRTPMLHYLTGLDCDGLWMRPVAQQLAEELAVYREEFALILQDLQELPKDKPILAEGCALLPDLLAAHGVSARRSLWIVPSPEFQLHHYAQRDWINGVVASCTSPHQAWQNWMDRDIAFAHEVTRQARQHHRLVITVDGTRSIDSISEQVANQLALSPNPQPPRP
jgi:hypothetical protein